MRVELGLPYLGIDFESGVTVSFWHVEEDEEFEAGEDLLEVTTNKATLNVPASQSGRLIEILAQEGAVVKKGDIVGIIETIEDNKNEVVDK